MITSLKCRPRTVPCGFGSPSHLGRSTDGRLQQICRRVGRTIRSGARKPAFLTRVKFRKKWVLALEMIDQARGWELADRIVVADARYGDVTSFREELEKRKLRYAVEV